MFVGGFLKEVSLGGHVRFGSKADVTLLNFDVRFAPESGHLPRRSGCRLWARSGRRRNQISGIDSSPRGEQWRRRNGRAR
jgi:hypothetical protein